MCWVFNMNDGKKRIFILLGMSTILFYVAVFAIIWFLISHQSPMFNKVLLIAVIAAFVVMVSMMAVSLGCLVFSLWWFKGSKRLNSFNRKIVEFFFPAVSRLGHVIGIERETIENSYIKIVNQMTVASGEKFAPQDILILAPHCLQRVECPHKITVDVKNCHRCGKCSINGLLNIAQERGVKFVVASGGTFARKFAKELRPKAIVAIACERDLTSGIQDMQNIPVVGVLNERPNGPCYNTTVQLCKVQQAIDYLIEQDTDCPNETI